MMYSMYHKKLIFLECFKYHYLTSRLFSITCDRLKTIFALSSGFGKCGIAVIRVSGPDSREVLKRMAGFKQLPEPRSVRFRKIRDPRDESILDKGLVIWFPGPNSFTGEDCCELQIHGGKAVINSVLSALSEINNFRPAQPGEFTKRAFYAGKLDLTEVEGLADLIEAETEAQRKQAFNQMEGSLSRLYHSWRQSLINNVAEIEAFIDFSESENLDDDLIEKSKVHIKELLMIIKKHIKDGRRGERLREGVQTVILGAPNVGKSSLLNLLSRKEESIVSSIAGTTRDIVSSMLDIGGYPVVIKDTAGLRQAPSSSPSTIETTSDPIEIEGISRALRAAKVADLILLLIDPAHLNPDQSISDSIAAYCGKLGLLEIISQCDNNFLKDKSNDLKGKGETAKCMLILNKIDILNNKKDNDINGYFDAVISCKDEEGVDKLLKEIIFNLEHLCGRRDLMGATCNQIRHKHCLNEVIVNLEKSISSVEPDIIAHHIRQALYALAKISGHVSTEQILDVIFKKFCVGK